MNSTFKYIVYVLVLCFFHGNLLIAQNSVLSEGDWYKIAILEDGVYKIDASTLDNLGLSRSSIDAKNLAIYGNAYNGVLPQRNSDERPVDLIENAIDTYGLADGSFDTNDYILFYGKSSDALSYDVENQQFDSEKNIYSDTSFYFITVKTSPAKLIESQESGDVSGELKTTYAVYLQHQVDQTNILSSGREWFGEAFNSAVTSNSIFFEADNLAQGQTAQIDVRLVSKTTEASMYTITTEGNISGTVDMTAVSGEEHTIEAAIESASFEITALNSNDGDVTVQVDFPSTGTTSDGYIDYVNIQMQNHLDMSYAPLHVFQDTPLTAYQISNYSNDALIWDITDPTDIKQQEVRIKENNASFQPQSNEQAFWAFDSKDVGAVIAVGPVNNQNLHGLVAVEVLYITSHSFMDEVAQLADFRLANDGLLTEVVSVQQIYNEYSSGRQDITAIRDFIRDQYLKHGTLKYVTLVGDASYDYKGRVSNNTNIVPVYEARNSVFDLYSYSSEDYYGFMDEDEGEWIETEAGDHTLEIGVGRIPAKTVSEIEDYVKKVILYETSTLSYANWRTRIAFFADDGDNNRHQRDVDSFAELVQSTAPEYNVDKLFLDAYEQLSLSGRVESPDAQYDFHEAITKGTLIVNYTGHGREDKLADETMLEDFMINNFTNRLQLPFFITATCQFGKYDDPNLVSGGELIVLNPTGGAIASLTSTRPVIATTNYVFNLAFYTALVERDGADIKRLGDLIKETKNNSLEGPKNRNYALLGDASMRLVLPNVDIELTSIDDTPIQEIDTLQALGTYQLGGVIYDSERIDSTFNGSVIVTIYDKPSQFITYGNEEDGSVETYDQNDVLLFQGEATVSSGHFNIDIILPKNINYSFDFGKISFYASNESNTIDATGYFNEIIVGGSVKTDTDDNTAPEMDVYLNNTGFVNGDVIGSNAVLLAKFNDFSGINISKAGFGNDITMFLDGDEGIVLNRYYTASIDTYQEGWLVYPLDNLSKGSHELTLVAFDNYNNRVEQTIEFVVTDSDGILLTNVINYPNPVEGRTIFSFSHDRLGEELDIVLSIVNLHGQEVLNRTYLFEDTPTTLEIEWDARDSYGNKFKKGIYIYKLLVRSSLDGTYGSKQRKLIVMD